MLYSDWINNSKEEKVKVIFLKHYVLRLDESKVIHFNKDGAYFLPDKIATELKASGIIDLVETVK